MAEELLAQVAERGYQARIVSIQRLDGLREEIRERYQEGLLDEELYDTYLARFAYSPPETLPQAKSIIVVAVPQPRIDVTFNWHGGPVHCTIPPTYLERETERHVEDVLVQVLQQAGYQVVQAILPKKLLAVRSGLATYGKNNVTYIPGMGSFYGLVAAYSDLPASEDGWREPQMMEACQNCAACQRHCPAGAITADRFLLHAERCITYHNEKPGTIPFPAWLNPSWHNCLIGCLHCQRVCPQNREVWSWVEEGAEFSEEETGLLLEGVPQTQMPGPMVEKLKRVNMDGYADALPRNLNALLHQRP